MSALYDTPLETFLETEEFVTAEEFLHRRERGEINPADVRYASGNPETGYIGGFWVKLKQPRYRVGISPVPPMCGLYE